MISFYVPSAASFGIISRSADGFFALILRKLSRTWIATKFAHAGVRRRRTFLFQRLRQIGFNVVEVFWVYTG